ncbi:MAG: hypothetical protein U1E53_01255 [Dongiaceae bacterium]
MARPEGRDRLPPVVQDLLAVDAEDRLAVHEIAQLAAERSGWIGVASVARLASCSASLELFWPRSRSRQAAKRSGADATGQRRGELLQRYAGIGDDSDIEPARAGGDLRRVDVDAHQLRALGEARRRGMADDVVHPRAQDQDQVGLAEGRAACGE